MKTVSRLGTVPASLPLLADDVLEFHAARLLLLLKICGTSGRIDSLTKMAKLDFFARYPDFFETARGQSVDANTSAESVESTMVRHHYGPWDKRYYHVLAYLESKGLVQIGKERNSYQIALTSLGADHASRLAAVPSFALLAGRMKEIKKAFGARSGSSLKNLIYNIFDREVRQQPLGAKIRR